MGNPQERVDKYHEYVIVGAGPAGVQAAYYLEKAGRDYVILEKGDKPGYFFETYPRHRTLISINKRFNYFPEDDYNL
ncbi:NAD(P)-binding domain-containing protein, partial [Clostridium perfringens]|nr:NAD(P)-binding domain-containing protein [Clostridium perfringens]